VELINGFFPQAPKRKLALNDEILEFVWRQLGCEIVLNKNSFYHWCRKCVGIGEHSLPSS